MRMYLGYVTASRDKLEKLVSIVSVFFGNEVGTDDDVRRRISGDERLVGGNVRAGSHLGIRQPDSRLNEEEFSVFREFGKHSLFVPRYRTCSCTCP